MLEFLFVFVFGIVGLNANDFRIGNFVDVYYAMLRSLLAVGRACIITRFIFLKGDSHDWLFLYVVQLKVV